MNSNRELAVVLVFGALAAPSAGTAARVAGPFDGRWTATVTPAQLRRAGASSSLVAKLHGPYTALYQNGHFEIRNLRTGGIARGTFSVRGKVTRVVFASGVRVKRGQISECTWSVYRDRLTFKAIPGRPSLLCDAGVWIRAD